MAAISTLVAAAAATLTMHQHILTPNTTSTSLANTPQPTTTLENMLAKPTRTLPIDNPSTTHSSDRTRSPPRPRFCAYDHDWVLPCLVGEVCKPVKDSLGQDTLFSQCVFDSTVHGGSDRIHVEEDHPENQQSQSELPTMRGSPPSAQAAPTITITTTTTTITAIASSKVTTTLTSRVRCTTALPDADRILSWSPTICKIADGWTVACPQGETCRPRKGDSGEDMPTHICVPIAMPFNFYPGTTISDAEVSTTADAADIPRV